MQDESESKQPISQLQKDESQNKLNPLPTPEQCNQQHQILMEHFQTYKYPPMQQYEPESLQKFHLTPPSLQQFQLLPSPTFYQPLYQPSYQQQPLHLYPMSYYPMHPINQQTALPYIHQVSQQQLTQQPYVQENVTQLKYQVAYLQSQLQQQQRQQFMWQQQQQQQYQRQIPQGNSFKQGHKLDLPNNVADCHTKIRILQGVILILKKLKLNID